MVDKDAAVATEIILRSVLSRIVDKPEKVSIVLSELGDTVMFDVRVAPGDVGRVIGRGGMTAKSLRTIVSAMANKSNGRYELRLPAGLRSLN